MMQSVAPKVVASMRVSTCLAPVAWNGIIPLHQRRIFPCRSSKADPIFLYRAYKRYQCSELFFWNLTEIDNLNASLFLAAQHKKRHHQPPNSLHQCRSCHLQISQYSQSGDAMMV